MSEQNSSTSEAQRLEMSRQSHLDWLAAQRADYEAHQAQTSGEGASSSEDFAPSGGAFDVDEQPVYRSLSMVGPSAVAALEYEEEPVYRSLGSIDLGARAAAGVAGTLPSPDTNASWVQAKRPPLLRRQNAFAFNSGDPSWLDLIPQNQSGR